MYRGVDVPDGTGVGGAEVGMGEIAVGDGDREISSRRGGWCVGRGWPCSMSAGEKSCGSLGVTMGVGGSGGVKARVMG